jgi:hypothetical protein
MKKIIERQLEQHEPGQLLPEDVAERAASGSGWQGEEITDEEWEVMQQAKSYDYQRSLFMAKQVWTVPKQCWSNAVRALRTRRKLVRDAWYVEGFVELFPGFSIEHGWLELPAGTILDTTRAYLEHYHGHESDNRTYHPVLKYSLDDLKGVRGSQLPLGMIELNIWQFEHLPAEIQEPFLHGQSLEAFLNGMREQVMR